MADTRNSDDLGVITVSAKTLGEILGIGDRMVRKLAEEKVLVRNSHGKYLLLRSVKNYILALKVSKSVQQVKCNSDESLDLEEEKAKHEVIKRQITDLKLQVIKGSLHKSEDVERVIGDMFAKFKSKMIAMPAKLARKLEGKQKVDIQKTLLEEITNALEELSEYNPSDYYSDEHLDIEEDYLYSLGDDADGEK